jgi:F-type H+-transporting ATPase subunit gamma
VDRVVLVYARFRGGTSHTVEAETVLPAQAGEQRSEAEMREAIFEPKLEALLPGLMRRYLWGAFGAAVLEASASEHAARVAAMTAATDNAEEMIHDLVMDYNRARQAGITKELMEIVSAAEATA